MTLTLDFHNTLCAMKEVYTCTCVWISGSMDVHVNIWHTTSQAQTMHDFRGEFKNNLYNTHVHVYVTMCLCMAVKTNVSTHDESENDAHSSPATHARH